MKFSWKIGSLRMLGAVLRARDTVGIKSECEDGSHILCMDFDCGPDEKKMFMGTVARNLRDRCLEPTFIYETKHGFHVVVCKRMDFHQAAMEYLLTPFIDLDHFAIGIRRRYWFLETKHPLPCIRNTKAMMIKR